MSTAQVNVELTTRRIPRRTLLLDYLLFKSHIGLYRMPQQWPYQRVMPVLAPTHRRHYNLLLALALSGKTVMVPNVVGLTQAAASSALASVGLFTGIITTANSNTVPAGLVISQAPFAGSSVSTGSSVNLVLSIGPFIAYTLLQTGISIMVNAGLVVSQPIQHVPSSVVPRGYIISQIPPKGSIAFPNTPVYFTVSDGPATVPATLTVPNVVGLEYLDAQFVLSINGFNAVNPIWQNSTTVADTKVISQSLPPGTLSSAQIPITLVVSMGPATVTYQGTPITVPAVTP